MHTSRIILACAALLASGAVYALAVRQSQVPPQILHSATAAIRDQQDDADTQLEDQIILNGMEAGKAGFHLLRPTSDSSWGAAYGRYAAHYDYRWFDVPVRYSDVEYQRLVPETEIPGFLENTTALVSQRRIFSNALATASVVSDGGGTFSVRATFPSRSVAALQALLAPTTTFPESGEFADWYRKTRVNGSASTPMGVAVVSEHIAFLPFVIQDVIAAATQSGSTVIVAVQLTSAEANDLMSRLNSQ
jgi:hypothetical protein